MGEKICISDLTLDALTAYIVGLGQPKFRAKQIFKWLHQKLVTEFSQMTDQPKALLAQLGPEFTVLRQTPAEAIASLAGEAAAQGVELLRQGKVAWRPGFDGEYGKLSFPGA